MKGLSIGNTAATQATPQALMLGHRGISIGHEPAAEAKQNNLTTLTVSLPSLGTEERPVEWLEGQMTLKHIKEDEPLEVPIDLGTGKVSINKAFGYGQYGYTYWLTLKAKMAHPAAADPTPQVVTLKTGVRLLPVTLATAT